MTAITIDSATIDGLTVSVAFSWSGAPAGRTMSLALGDAYARTVNFVPLPAASGSATVIDFEPPQNTPLTYVAFLHDDTGAVVATDGPVTCDGVIDAGADLIAATVAPTESASLLLSGGLVQKHTAEPKVLRVVGRPAPIVHSSRRKSWTSDLGFATLSLDDAAALDDVLDHGAPVCLRPRFPADYGLGAVEYLAVGDTKLNRVSPLALAPERRHTLPVAKIAPPPFAGTVVLDPVDECTFPGSLLFPGVGTFPGCSADTDGTYPGALLFPGPALYPGGSGATAGTYPSDYPGPDTYPGGA